MRYPGLVATCASPIICVIDDFLDAAACAELIDAARPRLRLSGTAFGGPSDVRTSATCMLRRSRPVVERLFAKVGKLLAKPGAHFEDPQVSRYDSGEYYKVHFDGPGATEPEARMFLACGGQRLATVLVYLNDVNAGGATRFPLLDLDVRPKLGRALVFQPGTTSGAIEQRLLHEALPAVDTKWVCQVWVRHGVDTHGCFMNTAESS